MNRHLALALAALALAPQVPAQTDAGTVPAAPPAAAPVQPADFVEEARLIQRVLACQDIDSLPKEIDAAVVAEHCKAMKPRMEKYQHKYVDEAKAFLARLRPAGIPATVVYPFGGGDLTSVLLTYPDATEITTISLEHAGDPRRIKGIDAKNLADSLKLMRKALGGILVADNSTSANLMTVERGDLPGQVSFFLMALALHGFEPASLKFFTLNPDGAVHYLSQEEIATLDKETARSLKKNWTSPDHSPAFSASELTFRLAGADPGVPVKVHRHVAFNLDNDHLQSDPSLVRHLEAKGRVSAMTKAASYLLWRSAFSTIREYLLAHMEIMFSDSTGIPPFFATKAGFTLETYGTFEKSFLGADARLNADFKKLWDSQPRRPLPFRYGYIDGSKHFHLVVAKRVPPAQ